MSPPEETPTHRAFYSGYVFILCGCFTPFKMVAYMLPLLFSAWLLVSAYRREYGTRLVVVLAVLTGIGLVYSLSGGEFILANYALAIVTYSSFLPVAMIDGRHLVSRRLYERILGATVVMVFVQGAWGIVQAMYGAMENGYITGNNGDWVEGTIHPQLDPEMAGSNPMFAINMALMIIACLSMTSMHSGKRFRYLVIGILSLILASVIHLLVFLAVAVVVAVMMTRVRDTKHASARRRKSLIAALLLGGFAVLVVGKELKMIDTYAEAALDFDALGVPRAILLYRVITELPNDAPTQPWIGVGPGQFSSRASMIASGLYLGGPYNPKSVPLLPTASTSLAREYCLPLLYMIQDAPDMSIGSTQQPFFSVLSVYTELGVFAVMLLAWWLYRVLERVRQRVKATPELRVPAVAFCTGVLVLALLGLQENYWEMPQAIFVGVLLMKVLYANLVYGDGV